jgi:hypothetical protein
VRRLRLVAPRVKALLPAWEKIKGAPDPSRPDWLLLFFDTCWLAGLLAMTLFICWVYDNLPAGDPLLYHDYAVAFWGTPPLLHSFPKEYPPLSLIPFTFTLWPVFSYHTYWVFAMWMGLIVCLSYLWFARVVSRTRAITYVTYLLVGATGTLLMRYDLLPALTTLAALRLAERRRYRWAYVLLAIGVLLKLYPGFLVPVLLVYQWRQSAPARFGGLGEDGWDWRQRLDLFRRGALAVLADYRLAARNFWQRCGEIWISLGMFVGVTLLGFSAPAIINYAGTVSEFKYALTRPIQIESVPASLLWLGGFLGYPVEPNQSFSSLNLVGPLDGVIRQLSLLAMIVGTLLVCWQVLRGRLSLGQGFVAMIAVVLASNKLLSPQYILWILPLVAYVEGFDLLWLTICALTTLIFPFIYQTRHPIITVPTNPAFLPTITLRNAMLVVATVQAVLGRRRATIPAPDEAEAEPAEVGLAEVARPEILAGRSAVALKGQDPFEEGRPPLVTSTQ